MAAERKLSVAIIVPTYNEASTIGAVVRGLRSAGTAIVVDDCSSDGSGEIAAREGAVVVRHQRNRGYDAALRSGFEKAWELGAEILVTVDADGQHDPALVETVLAPLRAGEAELVLGVRERAARFSEYLFNLYGRLRFGVPDLLCGLKAYRADLYNAYGWDDDRGWINTRLALAALRHGHRVRTVPVTIRPRVGTPRFGSILSANLQIFRALGAAIRADLGQRLSASAVRKATAHRPTGPMR